MGLIDALLPQYQFAEQHQRLVNADAAKLRAALARLPQWQDPWVSRFIALRELPGRLAARLGHGNELPHKPPFGLHEFALLAANPYEVVWGLAGAFWRSDYGLHPVQDAAHFASLQQVPRLALAFRIQPLPDGGCVLHTTTRVHCPDRATYRRFAPYWYLIRPVSGLIRQRSLRALAQMASGQ